MKARTDIIIVGGGIAGTSAAYFLSRSASVILLEAGEFIGTHSSGRSSEQYTVGIGAATMRRLAQASRSFFESPPDGFAAGPLVSPRGCLTVGRADQEDLLQRVYDRVDSVGAEARMVDRNEALALFPMLREEGIAGGTYEPGAMDVDTGLLLQGYARGAKARGARILTNAGVTSIERKSGEWLVRSRDNVISAPLLLNAAGAWGDEITKLAGLEPLGLTPCRRTAFIFAPPANKDASKWPHVGNVDYQWYVQPARDSMIGSLAEAVPTAPGDVYPDDIDVARAIDNIERDTLFRIEKPLSSWAGLRSFVADKNPVCGTRSGAEGFFWLIGQGGCGILTSPALGQAIAAVILDHELPREQRELGIRFADLVPDRDSLADVEPGTI